VRSACPFNAAAISRRPTLLAQAANLDQRRLLGRLDFEVLAVRQTEITAREITDTLSVRAFMLHCISHPFVNGLTFPLRHRCHYIDHLLLPIPCPANSATDRRNARRWNRCRLTTVPSAT